MKTSKECTRCQKTKPLSDFWKNSSAKDGRRKQCAECSKSTKRDRKGYFQEYNLKNSDRKKQWWAKNRDRLLVLGREYNRSEVGLSRSRRASRKQVKSGANAAYCAVKKAVADGELPNISDCSCRACGSNAEEYHHFLGYEKEHRLDVIPLCRVCHKAAHQTPPE